MKTDLTGVIRDLVEALQGVLGATGYQKESEKGAASGYAPLGVDTKVPDANSQVASTHATATTGVHGVGAGTVAKTSDITATKIDALTAGDDNTTLDTSTTAHGLAPKAVAPAAGLINVLGIANGETAITNKALFDATAPSTQAFADAAAVGTAVASARRDHKHAMMADPVTAHAAAADPHTGYRLESADHSHQSTGAQAGKLDHGLALDGLADDDHTQYQLESEKGAASGYASLSAATKVVEDPVNATATPTASKIPIADAGGKVDGWVSASSTTVSGITEAAIASEVTTGTDAARAVTPDALAGSDYGKRVVPILLNAATALALTDAAMFRVPAIMNGWNLVAVAAACKSPGSTANAVTITVKNGATSMLSTNLTIDQDEMDSSNAATPAVIDTAQDDVATAEQIWVEITGAGTAVTYLEVELTFQLP